MSSTLELNAARAERAYRKILSTYKESESKSALAYWDMDRVDRIY